METRNQVEYGGNEKNFCLYQNKTLVRIVVFHQTTQGCNLNLNCKHHLSHEISVSCMARERKWWGCVTCLADGVMPCCTTMMARWMFSSCILWQYVLIVLIPIFGSSGKKTNI
jgi:hypothetical protein